MEAIRKRRIIIFAAAILAFAVALSLAWKYTALGEVVTIENCVEWLEAISGKWWAPILVVLLYTPASVIMLPRPLITLAAVAAFGPWKGFALAMGGVVLSAFILYCVGRRVKEKTVRRLAGPKLDRLTRMLRKQGFMAIATVGLVPVAPFSVEMVVAGALRIRLRDLLLGVALAHLPGILGTTVLGDQIVAAVSEGREVNRAIIAGVVAALVVLTFVTHRLWRRMEAQA